MNQFLNRRNFLWAGAAGISITAARQAASAQCCANPSACCAGVDQGLKLGVASYSLRKFSLDEAIQITNDCGVKYITLKSFHLPYDSSKQERQATARKIHEAGLVLMGAGVVYLKNDEKQIRESFTYCRDAGMPVMVCAPEIDALPTVEKMVKEFDIKIAIHNHGPGDKRYPSPIDAYNHVKDMDPRMGCCIDIGHSVRHGDDEVDVIHAVKDRLHDFHIKDVTRRAKDGKTVPVGRGIINIPGVLQALRDIQFNGHLALEYERDADAPQAGMRESFGYIRGVLAVM